MYCKYVINNIVLFNIKHEIHNNFRETLVLMLKRSDPMSKHRYREPRVRYYYDRFGRPKGYSSNEGPGSGWTDKSKDLTPEEACKLLVGLGILCICIFGFIPLYQLSESAKSAPLPPQHPFVCWMLSAAPYGLSIGAILVLVGILQIEKWKILVATTAIVFVGTLFSGISTLLCGIAYICGDNCGVALLISVCIFVVCVLLLILCNVLLRYMDSIEEKKSAEKNT